MCGDFAWHSNGHSVDEWIHHRLLFATPHGITLKQSGLFFGCIFDLVSFYSSKPDPSRSLRCQLSLAQSCRFFVSRGQGQNQAVVRPFALPRDQPARRPSESPFHRRLDRDFYGESRAWEHQQSRSLPAPAHDRVVWRSQAVERSEKRAPPPRVGLILSII
jgi:hypothetical protein